MDEPREQSEVEKKLYAIALEINALSVELEGYNFMLLIHPHNQEETLDKMEDCLMEIDYNVEIMFDLIEEYKRTSKVVDMSAIKYYNEVKRQLGH